MCGGRGTRLAADVEKPLYEVADETMVDRVLAGLRASRVETVHGVVSPHAPATRDHLVGEVPLVDTPGDGYVADLDRAIERVGAPVLVVAADLPLLAGDVVDGVLAAGEGSRTVVVPAALKRALGVSVAYEGDWVPAGCNVVGAAGSDDVDAGGVDGSNGPDRTDRVDSTRVRSWDARLAVNVNRETDGDVAESLLTSDAG